MAVFLSRLTGFEAWASRQISRNDKARSILFFAAPVPVMRGDHCDRDSDSVWYEEKLGPGIRLECADQSVFKVAADQGVSGKSIRRTDICIQRILARRTSDNHVAINGHRRAFSIGRVLSVTQPVLLFCVISL